MPVPCRSGEESVRTREGDAEAESAWLDEARDDRNDADEDRASMGPETCLLYTSDAADDAAIV